MSEMNFSYNEIQVMRSALDAQIRDLRSLQPSESLTPEERNQLLDALKYSRSAYKRLGRILGEMES